GLEYAISLLCRPNFLTSIHFKSVFIYEICHDRITQERRDMILKYQNENQYPKRDVKLTSIRCEDAIFGETCLRSLFECAQDCSYFELEMSKAAWGDRLAD